MLSAVAVAFIATFDTYKFRLQASAMQLKQKELERERAVTLMTQMRLSSLESRVHPHFLFNTINSISSLIHEDPQRAEDMLARMAALLRFSLESSQPGLVPVERELSIVKDYLEIERARFAERLRYQIDCGEGPWLHSVLVPPLSIQTLVENSIKYAVNARREGALIRILLKKGPEDCVVEVQDDGPGFNSLTLIPGHGLDSLDERLTMLFGDSGRLSIHSTTKQTTVSFAVPRESIRRSGVRSEHESAARISGG
jgi:LytS/YehU family sensor histidine kinase